MVDHWLLRWLMVPLALLFGLGVALKNGMYRAGILNSVRFNVPVIVVGNLTVGGAGKTPHVEYLLRLLSPFLKTAVMSRGYGRETSGFRMVHPQMHSHESGDEPLIYARKYRQVPVAVSESRSVGIPLLLQEHPDNQVIILDDAFQHRSVTPYFSILLTEYQSPFPKDWLLPFGRLREWRKGYHRADILVVTKCPPDLSTDARRKMIELLRPLPHQRVYFSTFRYHEPYSVYRPYGRIPLSSVDSALIVCGIARTGGLMEYVQSLTPQVELLDFGDHHPYTEEDIELISRKFDALPGEKKIILTTEKDIVRLEPFGSVFAEKQLPVYLLPVEVAFLFDEGPAFDAQIKQLLLDFRI